MFKAIKGSIDATNFRQSEKEIYPDLEEVILLKSRWILSSLDVVSLQNASSITSKNAIYGSLKSA